MFKSLGQDHREMPAPLRVLDLPPPFRPVVLREAGDAFAHAIAHAEELGAGSLVFVGRFDLAEFAVVLEPEEPLFEARRSFYAGMTALADALAALAPPETPISIAWPDAIRVNGSGALPAGITKRVGSSCQTRSQLTPRVAPGIYTFARGAHSLSRRRPRGVRIMV